MERRNREIILFFEENENVEIINGKIVRLYMNRFTINEEERFEIAGVFYLAKEEPELMRLRISDMSLMTAKWNDDWSVIKNAFGKLDILNWSNTEIHIIMGTSIYIEDFHYKNSLIKLIRSWAENCRFSTFCLTVLSGRKGRLRTKTEVHDAYEDNVGPYLDDFFENMREWIYENENDHINSMRRLREFRRNFQHYFSKNRSDGTRIICNHITQMINVNQSENSMRRFLFLQRNIEPKSLNNDLENFVEDLCRESEKTSITEKPIERKLVLYKMLRDNFKFKNLNLYLGNLLLQSNCKRLTVYFK